MDVHCVDLHEPVDLEVDDPCHHTTHYPVYLPDFHLPAAKTVDGTRSISTTFTLLTQGFAHVINPDWSLLFLLPDLSSTHQKVLHFKKTLSPVDSIVLMKTVDAYKGRDLIS